MSLRWVENQPPQPQEYVALRAAVGLGPRTVKAATIGLKNGLYCLCLRDDAELVGMGRMVGDGGSFAEYVDIIVVPKFQGQGYGKEIVTRLIAWADANLPKSCSTSLIAAPGVEDFYAEFGFRPLTGMVRNVP